MSITPSEKGKINKAIKDNTMDHAAFDLRISAVENDMTDIVARIEALESPIEEEGQDETEKTKG